MTSKEDSSQPMDANSIPKPSIISNERSVSFSSIEIREYPLCMGDNPGCLRGVSFGETMFCLALIHSMEL